MELVASSKIKTGGLATAARAMDKSCLCPCDKDSPPGSLTPLFTIDLKHSA